MTNTYCMYTVLRYSWWWAVDSSKTCTVLYQINLRNNASYWLSLYECVTMHGPLNIKFTIIVSILISLTTIQRAQCSSVILISDSQPFATLTLFLYSLNLQPHAQENISTSKSWDYVVGQKNIPTFLDFKLSPCSVCFLLDNFTYPPAAAIWVVTPSLPAV
jgi:hypothetical protein